MLGAMRFPDRMHYDFPTIAAIFDEALIAHVGFVAGDRPVVIPTIHARIDTALYIHGSVLARWMNTASAALVCVNATIVDALILTRSAFQHSMNYRSAVVSGRAASVADDAEKLAALRAIVEHVCPGRWNDVRPPTDGELRTTLVLRIPIEEASAKIRFGPPEDFEADYATEFWAGQVPLHMQRGEPIPDPTLRSAIALPPYLEKCSTARNDRKSREAQS
jgi:uncharacterized protein